MRGEMLMTDLTARFPALTMLLTGKGGARPHPPFDPVSSRYVARSHRSPGAMTAAIAINGGIFALLVALPTTHYIVEQDKPLKTHWIEIDKEPPVVEPEPVKKPVVQPTQKTIETQKTDPQPFVQPPVISFDGAQEITGTREPTVQPVIAEPDPVMVHKPVFKAAARDPRYADAFRPDYPPALRRAGLEGNVTLRITIDEKGRVVAVEMVKASDGAFFREAKEQALRHWRFLPATSDGKPVRSEQVLTVQFKLEE